ncbi:MAG: Nif3-like dinuclear metal center hexameric protein [Methanoregulaceae archaeon]|nr:Nif3-like dinuclear metal center hexameric protein [Methanoregulaceae archaeon]
MDRTAWVREMEDLAPPGLAKESDSGRIGLIIEGRSHIGTVCCALDATPAVVRTAIDQRADMLVVHHTPFWTPLTSLTGGTATFAREVLSADMNLYVMHTNFDFAPGGVNDSLAELLGLSHRVHMSYGLVGTCTISLPEIASRLRTPLRIWGRLNELHHLAIAAGSGFDPGIIGEAADLGADAYLSAELKHATSRIASIPCIEATHYALEAPAMRLLAERKGWQFIDDPPQITICP